MKSPILGRWLLENVKWRIHNEERNEDRGKIACPALACYLMGSTLNMLFRAEQERKMQAPIFPLHSGNLWSSNLSNERAAGELDWIAADMHHIYIYIHTMCTSYTFCICCWCVWMHAPPSSVDPKWLADIIGEKPQSLIQPIWNGQSTSHTSSLYSSRPESLQYKVKAGVWGFWSVAISTEFTWRTLLYQLKVSMSTAFRSSQAWWAREKPWRAPWCPQAPHWGPLS